MSARAHRQGGLSFKRMRSAVARDSYSDFLPLVAWDPESQAFLCIDDAWGHAWEIVPSAYMFAHVQGALQGLLNIQFPDGTVLQLHTFADPLIDDALDAFLDLKTRDDPLIQASARRTHDYLSAGRHGLDALHGMAVSAQGLPARHSTIGRTWPIAEPDALAEIEAKVATLPSDMSKRFGPRSNWSALKAASLAVATTDRLRSVSVRCSRPSMPAATTPPSPRSKAAR